MQCEHQAQRPGAITGEHHYHRRTFMSSRIDEKKFKITEAAKRIGISPSGVRLLLDYKKLGFYQSGKRRIIGEGHLDEYLSKIDHNKTKAQIH